MTFRKTTIAAFTALSLTVALGVGATSTDPSTEAVMLLEDQNATLRRLYDTGASAREVADAIAGFESRLVPLYEEMSDAQRAELRLEVEKRAASLWDLN